MKGVQQLQRLYFVSHQLLSLSYCIIIPIFCYSLLYEL
jgi:hypothetical protein